MQSNEKYNAVPLTHVGRYLGQAAIPLGPDAILLDGNAKVNFSGAPFRPRFLVVCLCTQGEGVFSIDEKEIRLCKDDMYICVGDPLTKPLSLTPDFRFMGALTTPQCLRDNVVGLHHLWPFLHKLYLRPVIHLTPVERAMLQETFTFIFQHMRHIASSYATDYQNALIRLIYFDICSVAQTHFQENSPFPGTGNRLFDRFVKLVEDQSRVERQVTWYADQIGVSPKHLSEMVKQVSGRTASEWIRSFAVASIKSMLIGTDMSAKEIATAMNFSSQSMFCKFFSNATGYSPSAFRHMLYEQNRRREP